MISCSLLWREKKLHKLHCWWAGEGPPSYAKLIIAHWWNICCIRVTSSWVPGATGENPRRWCGVSDLQKNEARGLTGVYISNHIYKDEKELVGQWWDSESCWFGEIFLLLAFADSCFFCWFVLGWDLVGEHKSSLMGMVYLRRHMPWVVTLSFSWM